jgi:hypothetical protein
MYPVLPKTTAKLIKLYGKRMVIKHTYMVLLVKNYRPRLFLIQFQMLKLAVKERYGYTLHH